MENYATPPSTPRKVPSARQAEYPEDASMNTAESFSPVLRSTLLDSGDEEDAPSTITAGSQTDEPVPASTSGPTAQWDFHLDTVLNISIDDLQPDEVEEEDEDRSLVEEMERRYGSEQGFFPSTSSVFVSPAKGSSLPGKRGASGSLLILVLNHRRISHPGPLSRLSDLASNLSELDLAGNRLSHWPHVQTILSVMPGLRHCNLSSNDLSGGLEEGRSLSLPLMRSLVLNSTGVTWPTLFSLLNSMPYLEELHLSLNDYSSVGLGWSGDAVFPSLHRLHVSACRLSDWPSLAALLAHFPCLEDLVAADNPLQEFLSLPGLSIPESLGDYATRLLGCLRHLNINGWGLSSWSDVDRLNALPLLADLRLNHVPLLDQITEKEGRIHVIARLPALATYNGSDVDVDERETAERAFLRHFLQLPDQAKPQRYWELERIHGKLEPLADIELRPKTAVEVILRFGERREFRRVPLQQSVGSFKKSLQSFCGLVSARFRLFYHCHATVAFLGREELKLPRLALHSLPLEDGDLFEIEEKPEPVRLRRTSTSSSSSVPASPRPVSLSPLTPSTSPP